MSEKVEIPEAQLEAVRASLGENEAANFTAEPEHIPEVIPDEVQEEVEEPVEAEESTEVEGEPEPEVAEEQQTPEEQELPGGLKLRYIDGEPKYVAKVNGEEIAMSPEEYVRNVQSNAAITQGFQRLAQERRELEEERANAELMSSLFGGQPAASTSDSSELDADFSLGDDTESKLMKEVQELKQQITGITQATKMQTEAQKTVANAITTARGFGVPVPDDISALNHAIAAESNGFTPQFWQKANDPMYVLSKISEVYGVNQSHGVAPSATAATPAKKPPKAPVSTRPKKEAVTSEIKKVEDEIKKLLDKSQSTGPNSAQYAVKAHELGMKLKELKKKGGR